MSVSFVSFLHGRQCKDQDHLRMCQLLLDHQAGDEALACINKIDPARWNGPTYRAAISGHLFSRPRHLHEANHVLDQYLSLIRTQPLQSNNNNSSRSQQSREQADETLIQKWFWMHPNGRRPRRDMNADAIDLSRPLRTLTRSRLHRPLRLVASVSLEKMHPYSFPVAPLLLPLWPTRS